MVATTELLYIVAIDDVHVIRPPYQEEEEEEEEEAVYENESDMSEDVEEVTTPMMICDFKKWLRE